MCLLLHLWLLAIDAVAEQLLPTCQIVHSSANAAQLVQYGALLDHQVAPIHVVLQLNGNMPRAKVEVQGIVHRSCQSALPGPIQAKDPKDLHVHVPVVGICGFIGGSASQHQQVRFTSKDTSKDQQRSLPHSSGYKHF